jgi:hypothetical protein
MEKIYIVKFDGSLRGKTGRRYEWKRNQPFIADSRDMVDLNPIMYHTRPVAPVKHVPTVHVRSTTVVVPLRIDSKKNGWHTLYKGGVRVFSSRDLDEVKRKKEEYANSK